MLFLILISSKEGISEEKKIGTGQMKKRPSMLFAAQRNRSSFKYVQDPNLSDFFAPDFVWDIRVFKDETEFIKMTKLLRRANPNIILGSYASALYALAEDKDTYPPAKLPLNQCSKNWLLKNSRGSFVLAGEKKDRYCLDMTKQEVRQAVIGLAIARAKHNGLDALCFDNCYWGISPNTEFPVSSEEWTAAYMKFYKEAGDEARKNGLKCFVNVATYPEDIPTAFAQIAPFIDGIMTEMAFHRNVRTPEMLYRELKGYENVLKQGKRVFLFPRYREDEQFALLAITPLAKKYSLIYLSASGPTHYEPLYYLADIEWDIASN